VKILNNYHWHEDDYFEVKFKFMENRLHFKKLQVAEIEFNDPYTDTTGRTIIGVMKIDIRKPTGNSTPYESELYKINIRNINSVKVYFLNLELTDEAHKLWPHIQDHPHPPHDVDDPRGD